MTVTTDEADPSRQERGSNLFVRPLGYVEDAPVVRRVGDRDLYLGNAHAADPDRYDPEGDTVPDFEHVLTVARDAGPLTTHHRPLVDGSDCDWATFERAVDAARRLYREPGPLLIHCRAGISRSSAVVATTLAAEADRPFADALAVVQEARPYAVPHPRLHELGVVYLAARSSRR